MRKPTKVARGYKINVNKEKCMNKEKCVSRVKEHSTLYAEIVDDKPLWICAKCAKVRSGIL